MNNLLFKPRNQAPDHVGRALERATAIDVGTNSIHAVIVDIFADTSFTVVDKLREEVGFGETGLGTKLSEKALDRGVRAMKKIQMLSEGRHADLYLARATSAIREAENGGDFIQRCIDETGIKIMAIPGRKEAELIAYAVRRGVKIGDDPVLIMDIGGGSTEFILTNKKTVFMMDSRKLGGSRMYAEYVKNDPISKSEKTKLKEHFKSELERVFEFLNRYQPPRLIVTSGTMEAFSRMVAFRNNEEPISLNGYSYSRDHARELYKELWTKNRKERAEMPGMEEKRLDNILTGSYLLNRILKYKNLETIQFCSSALREGIILDHIQKEHRQHSMRNEFIDVRHQNVYELLRKTKWHEKHSAQVAKLALKLFDDTQFIHGMDDQHREWLKFASLLHDIGYHISRRKHHKHALYLILNSEMKGFRPHEIDVIGHVARYHRRSTPKQRHELYAQLPKELQQSVLKLSGFLRVADGLDRSHFQNVKALQVKQSDEGLKVMIQTETDAQLEIWGAMRKCELFEEVLGGKLVIERVSSLSQDERFSHLS